MELSQRDYLEAARLVAECKPSKLKIVLEILRQGGIEIPESVLDDRKKKIMSYEDSRMDRISKRYADRWASTNDPIIVTLRQAYIDGYKISDIAKACDITRTALYEYMIGRRRYSLSIEERFINGFNSLGILYPPDQEETVK